jgi:Rps23 Pro-64 3,4-dihydroxylase Tpa1-like proline 4-hydroxylase
VTRQARDIAVIYYLTKDWEEDMGGIFVDLESGVQHVPKFNSLVAFKVPRMHMVCCC